MTLFDPKWPSFEPIKRYKKFIDNEMLTVLGEMENSSQILDFMFLGSEWNAANRTELIQNGITHILNITKEIDNFYPGMIFIGGKNDRFL